MYKFLRLYIRTCFVLSFIADKCKNIITFLDNLSEDRKLFSKVGRIQEHPLWNLSPSKKVNRYELRNKHTLNLFRVDENRIKQCGAAHTIQCCHCYTCYIVTLVNMQQCRQHKFFNAVFINP